MSEMYGYEKNWLSVGKGYLSSSITIGKDDSGISVQLRSTDGPCITFGLPKEEIPKIIEALKEISLEWKRESMCSSCFKLIGGEE